MSVLSMRRSDIVAMAGKLARFAFVGGLGTLLYGALSLAIQHAFGVPPLATHIWAYVLAIPFSFFVQGNFTFQYKGPTARAAKRFVVTACAAFLVSTVAVYLSNEVLGYPAFVGIVVTMVIVPLVSFVAMLAWVYADKPRPEA